MRTRLFILIAALSLTALSCFGQFTTITGTVTDPDGQTWNNAAVTLNLFNPTGTPPVNVCSGTPVANQYKYTLSSAGAFVSATVDSTSCIVPNGTKWQFVLQSLTSAPPQTITPIAISGGTFAGGTYINSNITGPRFAPTFNTIGYSDTEATPPIEGSSYLRVTDGAQRLYHNGAWTSIGGGITSVTNMDIVTLATATADAPAHVGRLYFVKDSIDCAFVSPFPPITPILCQSIGNSGFGPLLRQVLDPPVDSKQSRGGGFCVFGDSTTYGDTSMVLSDSTFGIIKKAFNNQTNGCPGGQPPYAALGPFGGGGNYYNGGVGTLTGGNSTMGDYIDGQMLQNFAPLGDGFDPFIFVINDFGDDASCNGRSIGWGTIGSNCGGVAAGNVITAVTWGGTSPYGKIAAQNTALCTRGGSGTWSVPSNGFTHDIRTLTINSGGTGYVTGDIVTIQQGVAVNATAQVTASSGVVTGLAIVTGGNGYVLGTNLSTTNVPGSSSGSGSGLTVNITALDGYSLAGTVGATLTCTFPWGAPANSAFYGVWNVDGGANTATISIDGGSATTLSSGVNGGGYGTNYFSHVYYGQRFVTGAGTSHSFVLTVTAGTFQWEWFATAATNNYWDTFNYPTVIVDGTLYNANIEGLDAVIGSTTQQLESDGFHASWANKNSCFPQNGQNFEFSPGGKYANGLLGLNQNSGPHPNGLGQADVARCDLRAAGKVADPVFPNNVVSDGGVTTNVVTSGIHQKVFANGTTSVLTTRQNNFLLGPQTVTTASGTQQGYVVNASLTSATTPTYVRTGSLTAQSFTVCDNHTTPVTITAGDFMMFTAALNGGPFTGSNGWTVTTTAGDSFNITATSSNLILNAGDGVSVAIIGPFIGGASQTVTLTTIGFNCNSGSYDELANVNSTHPLNAAFGYYFNGTVPATVPMGPINISAPNTLALTRYYTVCSGTEGTPQNTGGLTWTSFGGNPNCTFSDANLTPNSYTATWSPGGVGVGSDRRGYFAAINGASPVGPSADPFTIQDAFKTPKDGINGLFHFYDVSCPAGQLVKGDGTGCTPAGSSGTCTFGVGATCSVGTVTTAYRCTFPNGLITETIISVPASGSAYTCTLSAAFPTACLSAQATNNNGGGNPLSNSAGAGCASASVVNVQVANSTETVAVHVDGH